MGGVSGGVKSVLDSGMITPAQDISLPSGYGPTAIGSSTGLGSAGATPFGPTAPGSSSGLGSLPAAPSSGGGGGGNIMSTLQGLSGLANSGLSIYGALNQQRPIGNILNGGVNGGLNPHEGTSLGGGGGQKLGGGSPSPLSVQTGQMSQSGLPNNQHFQVLLNLLGVKRG